MINDLTAISQIKNVQAQNPLGTPAQKEASKPKAAQDSFELSAEAKRLMQAAKPEDKAGAAKQGADGKPVNAATQGAESRKPTQILDKSQAQQKPLSAEDQLQLTRLQTRDAEVRAHEQAHVTAGGGLAGKPSYTEQKGPDGKMYAIGGQVPIDMSEGDTPEKTLEKARIIKAAALAPAQPSSEDRRIAAYAEQMSAEANMEIEKTRIQAQKAAQQQAASTATNPQNTTKQAAAPAVATTAAPAAAQAVAAAAPKQAAPVAKQAPAAAKKAAPTTAVVPNNAAAKPAPTVATPKPAKAAPAAAKSAVPARHRGPFPAQAPATPAKQAQDMKPAAPATKPAGSALQPGFSLKA